MTLKDEAQQIQNYLEIECSNNPEEIQERISTLSVYMARSGEMLAVAKKLATEVRRSELVKQVIEPIMKGATFSATTQKELIKVVRIK